MRANELPVKDPPKFLSGGGEMGKRIREYDWSATPLGSIENWPQSLRTCVRIMLSSRQPIWIGWGKKLIKLYNDPYRAIVGGKHPWALGTPASVVWKEVWRDIEPMLKQVMEKGEGTYVESRLLIMERYGYPEETYYTFSYTPIPGDNGEIAGMFCANTDDTAKITGERQLRTLTQLGKRLTDCKSNEEIIEKTVVTLQENPEDFPFAIFRTIKDNKATLACSTPLGAARKMIPVEVHLNSGDTIAANFKRAIETGKPQVDESIIKNVDFMPKGAWQVAPDKVIILPIVQTGTKEPYGVLVIGLNPYRLLDEKYLGFFSLVADQVATSFADVHAFEEERKRAEALAEIDKAKTAFFSNISHEFRTPLTLMLGPIQDALNDPNTIPVNKERIGVAYRNLQRLLKLVNNLLEFSRLEAGRMQPRFERVNLSNLTKDLASIFRSAVERAGMELIIDCNEEAEAYVDVDMWEKIVLNLLSNAFKYTHKGSITVRLKKYEDDIGFSVADTGVGIPDEELNKIFVRFHRIQSTGGRSQEGTGIGLALVSELVKVHMGIITVKSKVGEGSIFTITLKDGKAHLPPGQIVNEDVTPSASSEADIYLEEALKWLPVEENSDELGNARISNLAPLRHKTNSIKPKVLFADDNADMRYYVSDLLSAYYEVKAVGNGKEAFEVAIQTQPDLILSDVMMPGMDGFELVKHLKDHPKTKHTPIILLSAKAGEEATVEGLQTGVDDYLIKPFSAKELLSRIDSSIKIAKSRISAFQQLYRLFMNAPVAIAILRGRELRYELTNERYLEIAAKRDMVGKTLEEAFPELEGQGVKELLRNVYESGNAFYGNEFEAELMRSGKRERVYWNFICTPLKEVNEVISGVMVVAAEVTEMVLARKLLEQSEAQLEQEVEKRTEDLERINQALKQSNKELEEYAFVTSHDLQEPLRKIQVFSHMLYERNVEKLDEKSVQYYHKVVQSAKRMSTLIQDLLNFSRLTRDHQYVIVDLNETLKDVINDFELTIQEKKATINADRLPVIEALPLQMNQLFSNLLSNALKFSMPEREPEIKIKVKKLLQEEVELYPSLLQNEDYVKIIFMDNGIGFHSSYAKKIFKIFQRLNDRTAYEGTGIGLALCSRIVGNHHGLIYAESKEAKGANFHVILPLKQR